LFWLFIGLIANVHDFLVTLPYNTCSPISKIVWHVGESFVVNT
jgi:hypothetical protein